MSENSIRIDSIGVILLVCTNQHLDNKTARLVHAALVRLGVTEEEFQTALTRVTVDVMLMELRNGG